MLTSAALLCLALNIYHEARGEPIIGQRAVAHVVVNRVKDPQFPDEVCKVVYQDSQFSWVKKRKPKPHGKPWEDAKEVASTVLLGKSADPTKGATHFHTTLIKPKWSYRLRYTRTISKHVFYRQTKNLSVS